MCQDGFVAPKGGVRASVLKSFYSKTSAHPTENLPSLKGTLSDITELTSMIPNAAWQNRKVLIAKDIYVCELVHISLNRMSSVLQHGGTQTQQYGAHNKKLPTRSAILFLERKKKA